MTEFPQVLAGRYEIRDLIGRGGMAEVHLGYDKRLSRIIAIKLLRQISPAIPPSRRASAAKRSRPQL